MKCCECFNWIEVYTEQGRPSGKGSCPFKKGVRDSTSISCGNFISEVSGVSGVSGVN